MNIVPMITHIFVWAPYPTLEKLITPLIRSIRGELMIFRLFIKFQGVFLKKITI